jgi:hypothetical protein
VPFLRGLFLFARLHWNDLALCLSAGAVSVLWFEVFKIIGRPLKYENVRTGGKVLPDTSDDI